MRRLRVIVAVCGASLVACGLTVVGVERDEIANGNDDASIAADGALRATPLTDSGGRPVDATDAEVDSGDAGCPPRIVADDFDTLDPSRWALAGTAEVDAGEVTLVRTGDSYASGGLWLKPPATFDAFDVHFRLLIVHSSNASPPSDGLTFAWLESSVAPGISQFDRGLGIPAGVDGYGVEIDTYLNVVGFIHVDASKGNPGSYTWTIGTTTTYALPLGVWHDVRAELADRGVRLSVDDVVVFSQDAGAAYSAAPSYLGFTAHSGNAGDAFLLDSFDASFPTTCP